MIETFLKFFQSVLQSAFKKNTTEIEFQQVLSTDLLDEKIQLDRKLVVVDVGCRWGFAERFTKESKHFFVYGFDPDIEECKKLDRRYKGGLFQLSLLAWLGLLVEELCILPKTLPVVLCCLLIQS